MKVLAYLLLIASLVGAIVIGIDWSHQEKDLEAAADQNMNMMNAQMRRDNDAMVVHNDNLKIETAKLEGRSTTKLRNELSRDIAILDADKLSIEITDGLSEWEPNGRLAEKNIARDEFAAAGAALLLIFSGFAFASSGKQPITASAVPVPKATLID